METLWRDVRHGLRALAGKPVLAAVVVATLALGIGANTAIFSVVYSILLRPFPYREPDRLIRIESLMTETGAVRGSSLPDVEDWRRRNQTLSDLGAYTTFDADVRGDGPARPVRMTHINPSALAILGVEPILGRHFPPRGGPHRRRCPQGHPQLRAVAVALRRRPFDPRRSADDERGTPREKRSGK